MTSLSVLGRLYVLPLLADFAARYPGVQIEILSTDRIVDMIEESFDLGIRAGPVPDATDRAYHVGQRLVQPGLPVGRGVHPVPLVAEQPGEQLPQLAVVLHDQQGRRRLRAVAHHSTMPARGPRRRISVPQEDAVSLRAVG